MSSVVISGDTSGAITLQAPAVAGSTTLNLPATTGSVVVTTGNQTVEFADGSASAPSITNSGDTNTGMFFPAADTIAFAEGGVESMRIDANGNLGVGGTGSGQRLFVNSGTYLWTTRFTSSNGVATALELSNSNTRTWELAVGGNTPAGSLPAGGMYFYDQTAGQARFIIDTSGNILFNTTDTTMFNNTSGSGICYRVNSSLDIAASSDNCLILNRMTSTGPIAEFRYSGTIVGSISVTGSATAYNTSSDYRLKENIAPMQNALDTVAQLNPVTYNWKVDGSEGQGFIAHELQAVVPDCVTGEKDAVDEEGNPVYQGVDTSFLVATLTKAIQELKAIVDEQAEKIKALEGVA